MTSDEHTEWGEYGRRPGLILAGVAFIDAVERGILPGVLSDAQDDLGFSDFQAGLLGSALVIAGVLIVIPAGRLADRANRPRVIATVLASWGIVAALTAGVRNFGQFLAARALLGVADTIDNPASSSLIADYYPSTARGRVFGAQRIAPILGSAVGTGLGGVVAATLGWRWAFVLVGVPGSLFALAVLRLPDPPRGGQEGVDHVETEDDRSTVDQLRALRGIASLRGLALGLGSTGVILGIAFWSPSFFERHLDFTTSQAAGAAAVALLVGGLTGSVFGARHADRARAVDPAASAKAAALGFASAAGAFMLGYSTILPAGLSVVSITIGVICITFTIPGLFATLADIVPGTDRGMAFSLATFVVMAVTAVMPPLIGIVADQFEYVADAGTAEAAVEGDLRIAMLLLLPLLGLGGLVVRTSARHIAGDRARVVAGG